MSHNSPAESAYTPPPLPARRADAHKGTCGTVSIVGGCDDGGVRMLGAPVLAALAATRAGAGLVRLVMPERLLTAALSLCPQATGMAIASTHGTTEPHEASATLDQAAERSSVLALGPGLGTSPGAVAATLRAIQRDSTPLVLDADGINALSLIPEFFRDFHAAAVLTPHPGEFKRLCMSMGLKNHLGLADSREQACEQLAQRLGRIVVLKGAGTVVSDGHRTWTCPRGHPCLATGGTGDVLTGIIAALIAQFVPSVDVLIMRTKLANMPRPVERPLDLYDAACLGVWIHASAGETWAQRRGASAGLSPVDLIDLIPEVAESLRTK